MPQSWILVELVIFFFFFCGVVVGSFDMLKSIDHSQFLARNWKSTSQSAGLLYMSQGFTIQLVFYSLLKILEGSFLNSTGKD